MPEKLAYVVVGPESSGNRLVTSLLIRAGCQGTAGMHGDFVQTLPTVETPAAIIRSVPHGPRFPDLGAEYRTLRNRGYYTRYVVTMRDPFCVVSSMEANRGHSKDQAWEIYRRAYPFIFRHIELEKIPWTAAVYESIVARPVEAVRSLLLVLGLSTDGLSDRFFLNGEWEDKIVDANRKYYGES